jgi:hypothetical protein
MQIEQGANFHIKVSKDDDSISYIETQSVEACLMFAILAKLEAIRCAIIDVENAVDSVENRLK